MGRPRLEHRDGDKFCGTCQKWVPLTGYWKSSLNWDGLSSACKPCVIAANRKSMIKRKYGLTVKEYEAMRAAGCAICGSHERVVLDHDHRNGKVRAALCNQCNRVLGLMGDDAARLHAAGSYIEDWRASHG